MKDIRTNVARGFPVKITMALVGFLGSIALAQIAGPALLGTYYVLTRYSGLAAHPISGYGSALKKRISEESTDNPQVVGLGIAAVIALLIIGVPIAGVLDALLSELAEIEQQYSLVWIYLFYTISVIFTAASELVSGVGEVANTELADLVRSIGTVGGQLALLLTIGGVAAFALGSLGGLLLSLPVILLYLPTPAIPSRDLVRRVNAYARYSTPRSIARKLYESTDLILISVLIMPDVVGQYQVAANLLLPGVLLSGIISNSFFVKASNNKSKEKGISDLITQSRSFASVLAVPLLFGSLIINERLILTIYGSEFSRAANFLVALGVYRLFESQNTILAAATESVGRPDLTLRVTVLTVLLNIGLGYVLFRQFGVLGILSASVISEATRYFIYTQLISSTVDLSYRSINPELTKQLVSGTVMSGLLYVSLTTLHTVWTVPPSEQSITSGLALIALVGVGAVFYSVTLLAVRSTVALESLQLVRRMVPSFQI